MIKVQERKDIELIKDQFIYVYIENLLEYLFKTYEVNTIESYGAIFYIEKKEDFLQHSELFLSSPLYEDRFEWIDHIGNGYVNGIIILDNQRVINLIGKIELFTDFMEE